MINYHKYIQSDKWREKREAIIRERQCCEQCGNKENLQVHHLTYKRLGNEENKDLMLLCQNCHQNIHTDKDAIPYMNIIDGKLELFSNRDYIKIFYENPLPEEFNFYEIGKILKLMRYISKHQLLKICNHNLDRNDVVDILRINERQAKEFLDKLKDYNIVKHIVLNGCKYYAFNPLYALYGNRISYITYGIFTDVLKNRIPRYVRAEFEIQLKENLTNIQEV